MYCSNKENAGRTQQLRGKAEERRKVTIQSAAHQLGTRKRWLCGMRLAGSQSLMLVLENDLFTRVFLKTS